MIEILRHDLGQILIEWKGYLLEVSLMNDADELTEAVENFVKTGLVDSMRCYYPNFRADQLRITLTFHNRLDYRAFRELEGRLADVRCWLRLTPEDASFLKEKALLIEALKMAEHNRFRPMRDVLSGMLLKVTTDLEAAELTNMLHFVDDVIGAVTTAELLLSMRIRELAGQIQDPRVEDRRIIQSQHQLMIALDSALAEGELLPAGDYLLRWANRLVLTDLDYDLLETYRQARQAARILIRQGEAV